MERLKLIDGQHTDASTERLTFRANSIEVYQKIVIKNRKIRMYASSLVLLDVVKDIFYNGYPINPGNMI